MNDYIFRVAALTLNITDWASHTIILPSSDEVVTVACLPVIMVLMPVMALECSEELDSSELNPTLSCPLLVLLWNRALAAAAPLKGAEGSEGGGGGTSLFDLLSMVL